MTAEKRQMLRDTAAIIQSTVNILNSDTIEEEDILKVAKTLTYTSMSIQAIIELPDRKGK